MKRMLVVLATVVMVILSLPLVSFGLNFSSLGTATVDGKMSPGEWDRAAKLDFQVNLPLGEGSTTTPGTLYVMNDENNLYIAVKFARTSLGSKNNFLVDFSNKNTGIAAPGDDAVQVLVGTTAPLTFGDMYLFTCNSDPAGTANCSTMDTKSDDPRGGILPVGPSDGKAAASNDGSFTVIELSHTLSSGDTLHDFSLNAGSTVGFRATIILDGSTAVPMQGPTPMPNISISTSMPTNIPVSGAASGYGQITIASSVVTRAIDIKPGGGANSINTKSEGKIPVAILSTRDFDAPASVDRESLTFGRTGDEHSRAFCNSTAEDVNGDGLFDLVCHFTTQATGLQAGDTAGILKGRTTDGTNFTGKDSVRIVR